MNRRWMTRGTAASALVLGMLVAAFASCAETAAVEGPTGDPTESAVPEASTPADVEAGTQEDRDAGCDASDPGCTTTVVSCESVDWCLQPTPVTSLHALTSIWGSSKNDVWAVGSAGSIVHYDGSAWTLTPSGVPNTLFGIWGSGPKDLWVVSSGATLLHSTGFENGTAVWTNAAPAGNATSNVDPKLILGAVWGSSASDLRVGTRGGSLYIPYNPSTSFSYVGSTNQLGKMETDDGGVRWRVLPGRGAVASIWGSSADDVWMAVDRGATERGTLLHGVAYEGPPPNPGLLSEPGCSGCVPGCTACAIVDDRLAWTSIDSQSKFAFQAIWGSSAGDVWAVGEFGSIRRFQAGDVRFQKIESPTEQTLRGVWGSGPSDIWIVGDEGTVLHFDGTKVTPSTVELPLGPKPNLRGVWGSSPSDVWIVGDGVVLHYTGPKPSQEQGGQ